MKIFSFDPADHRDHYAEHGWVHIPGGIDPEFFRFLEDYAEREFAAKEVEGRGIGGRKSQAIFEAPGEANFPDQLFDSIAELCGFDRAGMTLSERHIKAYDADAPEEPIPHKDRFASEASIGLSIFVPEGSHLVLYPYDETEVNPLNVSAAYLQGLPPEKRPEVTLKNAREVIIRDSPGDVMVFRGSAVWHMRRKPAGARNLYLKLNSFNSDPLGEDPQTAPRREATVQAVENGASIDGLLAVPSRRFDTISREFTRTWDEVVLARIWGDAPPVILSEDEVELVKAVGTGKPVSELAVNGGGADAESALRRLARTGVIDLVSP